MRPPAFCRRLVRLHLLRGGAAAHSRFVGALSEIARVTRPGGRVLIVEPDNAARYWFSSVPSGMDAFEIGRRFFGALASVRGESPAAAVGPLVPGLLAQPASNRSPCSSFPVSVSHLGAPPPAVWDARRKAVRAVIAKAPDESLRRLGADFLKAIDQYARDARAPGPAFVEIQNTMLFATVGQRPESRTVRDGGRGWDDYAPFYDWENARTVARRDVAFWQRLAAAQDGPVLELGCGTGRIAVPVVTRRRATRRHRSLRADARRAPAAAARGRGWRSRARSSAATSAPCRSGRAHGFGCVMAPYGILQSLTRERDLTRDAGVGGARAPARRAVRASISCPICRGGANIRRRPACADGTAARRR